MKNVITWVVVADGTRARIYENDGPNQGLTEVAGGTLKGDRRRSREIVSDRPGRSFDSKGAGRHAMAYPTDADRHEHQEFARHVVDWIEAPRRRDRYDQLAIVAAPRTLGDIRDLLSDTSKSKVTCELDKDLVAATADDIVNALSDKIRL
jgi:protein required for attachment to host cells